MRPPSRQSRGYPWILWLAVNVALLGSFQFGYHLSVLNTVLYDVVRDLDLKWENGGAVLTTAPLIGAAAGSLLAGQMADRLGPRKAQMVNQLWFLGGAFLTIFLSRTFWGLLVSRFISGIGAGSASLFTPRYIAEVAPTTVRGALGTQNQVWVNVGILVGIVIGLPIELQHTMCRLWGHEVSWWEMMLLMAAVPSLLQGLLLFACPESPVWLEWQGKSDEADDGYVALWGRHALLPDDSSESDLVSLPRVDEFMTHSRRARQESWLGLLQPQYRRILWLAVLLPVFQQLSGIYSFIFYSTDIFYNAGIHSPILCSSAMAFVNLIFTIVAAGLMDQAGRKPLLQLSHVGMSICLAAMFGFFSAPSSPAQILMSFFAVVFYVMFFAMGAGPIPWLYISEILPDSLKGRAGALTTSVNWAMNILVTVTFPTLVKMMQLSNSSGLVFAVYAFFNAIAAVVISQIMVETKKKSLHQIQRDLLLPTVPNWIDEPEDTPTLGLDEPSYRGGPGPGSM